MSSDTTSSHAGPAKPEMLRRLIIWGLFFALVYLLRSFFFLGFMTFLVSYIALGIVDWAMRRLSPNQDRPALRKWLTVGFFLSAPLILLFIGTLVLPALITQGQHLAGWLSQVNPESEVARLLETHFGPTEFKRQLGSPDDPRYKSALEEFRKSGEKYVDAYHQFPKLVNWVQGSFDRQFADAERGKIRFQLSPGGTTNADFENWIISKKAADLHLSSAGSPLQILHQLRKNPKQLAALYQEWLEQGVAQRLAAAKESPEYRKQFREHYDRLRAKHPGTIPYTFDQFLELQSARAQGQDAFASTLAKIAPVANVDERLRADFEAAKQHELFQAWWASNSFAKLVRHQFETDAPGVNTDQLEQFLSTMLDFPLDLTTALLLSFFICIDFQSLKKSSQRLRQTWLRDVYDEIVPALSKLGSLVGRSLQAQGMIALCNAGVLFIALTVLGVEHAAILGATVFVLCLVPTFGTIIAWVIIVTVALIQPGGGFSLAFNASLAVLAVVILETFVFSPRILGKLMELHPALIIIILPIAHYFFGIWGLILAVPVSVYVINDVILGGDQPELKNL